MSPKSSCLFWIFGFCLHSHRDRLHGWILPLLMRAFPETLGRLLKNRSPSNESFAGLYLARKFSAAKTGFQSFRLRFPRENLLMSFLTAPHHHLCSFAATANSYRLDSRSPRFPSRGNRAQTAPANPAPSIMGLPCLPGPFPEPTPKTTLK